MKKAVLVGPDQCEIYSEVRRHVGVTSEKKKKKKKNANAQSKKTGDYSQMVL